VSKCFIRKKLKLKQEAIEKFYDMMTSALEPCDSDNFTIDHVEEEGDE
jgi:hypothetical protein